MAQAAFRSKNADDWSGQLAERVREARVALNEQAAPRARSDFWLDRIHYFFSSITSHTAAVLPVVLAVGTSMPGMSVPTLTLLCVYSLGLMGVISPYATELTELSRALGVPITAIGRMQSSSIAKQT